MELSLCFLRYILKCFEDDIHDDTWCRDARRMVNRVRPHLRPHSLRHEELRLLDDHAILFGEEETARLVLPERSPYRDSDTRQGNRSLDCGELFLLLSSRVLRKRRSKGIVRKIDQTVAIRGQLRSLGMRCRPIEHISDLFPLVRCQRRDVDERLDLLALRFGDDCARISMADQHDGTINPL